MRDQSCEGRKLIINCRSTPPLPVAAPPPPAAEGSPAEARRCRPTPTAPPAARPRTARAAPGGGRGGPPCCPHVSRPPPLSPVAIAAALPGQLQEEAAHADPPRRPGRQHRRQLRQLDYRTHRPGAPVGQGQQRRRHPAALRCPPAPTRNGEPAVRCGVARWGGRPGPSRHGTLMLPALPGAWRPPGLWGEERRARPRASPAPHQPWASSGLRALPGGLATAGRPVRLPREEECSFSAACGGTGPGTPPVPVLARCRTPRWQRMGGGGGTGTPASPGPSPCCLLRPARSSCSSVSGTRNVKLRVERFGPEITFSYLEKPTPVIIICVGVKGYPRVVFT